MSSLLLLSRFYRGAGVNSAATTSSLLSTLSSPSSSSYGPCKSQWNPKVKQQRLSCPSNKTMSSKSPFTNKVSIIIHSSLSSTSSAPYFSTSIERHGTTILCVRKSGMVCMMGDGQVSMGSVVVKPNAKKIRRILPSNKSRSGSSNNKDKNKSSSSSSSSSSSTITDEGKSEGENNDTTNIKKPTVASETDIENTKDEGVTIVGFAGSTADAFTLLERLESKLEEHPQQLTRSCVELAKGWRTDKYLRRLEASLLVADSSISLELTGNGDVLEGHDGVLGVGSGSPFAIAAARALMKVPDLTAEEVARRAMEIASDMCVFTNKNFMTETLKSKRPQKLEEAEGKKSEDSMNNGTSKTSEKGSELAEK